MTATRNIFTIKIPLRTATFLYKSPPSPCDERTLLPRDHRIYRARAYAWPLLGAIHEGVSCQDMDVEQLQQHARRLLSNGRVAAAAAAVASPGPAERVFEGGAAPAARPAPFSSLDATVITVLSLLLCVLVVGLVLHAIARCAFRVTRRVCYGQEPPGDHGEEAAAAAASRPTTERCARVARKKPGCAIAEKIPAIICPAGGLDHLAGCGSTECAICLTEFAQGDRVRVLPRCGHGFHARCIDRWLAARQTCPTCRREPFAKPAPPPAVQLQVLP
uniref:RING-type domain-containing protein n=1 Tax=Oryza punctata TaxID=4537 RepID=A0A0E0JRF8_ORYPU